MEGKRSPFTSALVSIFVSVQFSLAFVFTGLDSLQTLTIVMNSVFDIERICFNYFVVSSLIIWTHTQKLQTLHPLLAKERGFLVLPQVSRKWADILSNQFQNSNQKGRQWKDKWDKINPSIQRSYMFLKILVPFNFGQLRQCQVRSERLTVVAINVQLPELLFDGVTDFAKFF